MITALVLLWANKDKHEIRREGRGIYDNALNLTNITATKKFNWLLYPSFLPVSKLDELQCILNLFWCVNAYIVDYAFDLAHNIIKHEHFKMKYMLSEMHMRLSVTPLTPLSVKLRGESQENCFHYICCILDNYT